MKTLNLSISQESIFSVKWWIREVSLVLLASFLIGLFAHVVIPLPFTPVPIATQPHLVLFLAALLGPKRGAAAVLAFLCQGAMGLPVFAQGAGGIAALCGPTAGYLFGYLIAAYVVGATAPKHSSFVSMALGNLIIYFFGVIYLATFIGLKSAILLGMVPFLLPDLLKLFINVQILRKVL